MEEPRQIYRRLSPKLVIRRGYHFPADSWTYAHWCDGCKQLHDFAVDQPFRNNARWTWNGNESAPTFTPSMNIVVGPFPDQHTEVCHYFLTHGRLLYLPDCTHELKSHTVDLPDIPQHALQYATEIP